MVNACGRQVSAAQQCMVLYFTFKFQKADIAVGALTMNAEREAVVDFTYPIFENKYSIVVVKPTLGGSSLVRVFRPLSPAVWLLIVASIIVCALLFHGTVAMWRLTHKTPVSSDLNYSISETFNDTFFGIYSLYVQQSAPLSLHSMSSRCVLAFWMLFCILMTTSYTSELIGYLTVSDTKPAINSLKDLANSDVIPLTAPASSVITFFQVNSILCKKMIL